MKKILLFSLICLMALMVNAQKYVDLGLPSGTVWKDKNEEGGLYTYDQAKSKFSDKLPSKEQFEELKKSCRWTWTGNGYKVVGPNGKSIDMPAGGFRYCSGNLGQDGSSGCYWSSTSDYPNDEWYLFFSSNEVNMTSIGPCRGLSVRLAIPTGYVDLGLPSGTIWKDKNEEGFYTYEEAVRSFGSRLPTKEQFEELKNSCQWIWTGSGYKVVGPNGNSIFLPATGFQALDGHYIETQAGNYWSSTYEGRRADHAYNSWYLLMRSDLVYIDNGHSGLGYAVRLALDK